MIRGVVFDLDGTLLDTEKLFIRFWMEAANRMGFPMERRHALMIRGMASDLAEELLRREVCPEFAYHQVRALRGELMEAYIEENGVETKPGAQQTLEALKARGFGIALATASNLERASRFLKQTGLYDYFDNITVAAMVRHGKPAPDIYLHAAAQLGLEPYEAAAVEDAPNGLISAHAAGLHPVLIPDQDQPDEALRALCAAVLPSLEALVPWIEQQNQNCTELSKTVDFV